MTRVAAVEHLDELLDALLAATNQNTEAIVAASRKAKVFADRVWAMTPGKEKR